MRLVILQNGVVAPFSPIDGECVVELTDIYLETAELNVDDDLLLTMNDSTTHLVPLSTVYMRDLRLPVVLVTLTADVATMQINEVSTIGGGAVNFTVPDASLFDEGEIIIFRRNGPNDLNLNAVGLTTINGILSMTLTEDYRVVWFTKRGNDWTAIADFDEAGGVGGDSLFTLEANEALWGANTATITGDPRGQYAVDVQGHRTLASQVASGDGSVAIGNRTTAGGNQSIAIGQEAEATGLGRNIAIGVLASADVNSIAIGDSATVNAPATGGGISIGNYSNVAGIDSIAIGSTAVVTGGARNISIGYSANADGQDAVVVGSSAVTASDNTIALGNGASIAGTAERSIAIGLSASVNNAVTDAVVIGPNTEVRQVGSVVIGANAYSGENNIATESHVVIGHNASVPPNSPGGIAIGDGANLVVTPGVDSPGRIAIGEGASVAAGTDNAIAIGANSYATGGSPSVALGNSAQTNSYSIAIGSSANASSGSGIVIGSSATDSGATGSVVIGNNAIGGAYDSTVIGNTASGQDSSVTIGFGSTTLSPTTVLVGKNLSIGASSQNSIGILGNVDPDSPNSIAIGTSASVGQYSQNGIAIGNGAGVGTTSVGAVAVGGSVGDSSPDSIAIKGSIGNSSSGISIGWYSSIASGTSLALAVGISANVGAGANYSTAIGIGSNIGASSQYALAVGHNSTVAASSSNAIAIGSGATSFHSNAVTIGRNVLSTATNQVSIGHGNSATQKIVLDNGQLTIPALDVNGHITEQVTTTSTGINYVINMAVGTVWVITLTASITISFSNVAAGRSCTVNLIQGGGGSNTVTWTGVTWPGGVAPTLSTTAGQRDKIVFDSYNGSVIDGSLAGLNYS